MINKNKTHRLMIQVTIRQYEWLNKKSRELDLSISQLVRWLLNKKIRDINDIKILETNPKEAVETSTKEANQEEWNQLLNEIDNLNK